MEKLLYFVGGIIVGSISTLAALGFSEEELDGVGGEDFEQGKPRNEVRGKRKIRSVIVDFTVPQRYKKTTRPSFFILLKYCIAVCYKNG